MPQSKFITFGLCSILALNMAVFQAMAAEEADMEEVIITVGDQQITRADFKKETDDIATMMQSRGVPPEQFEQMVENFRPQIVEGMVTRALIEQACENKKITVAAEEVAAKAAAFEKNLPPSMNLDNLLQQSGLTREMFEKDLREQLKLEKLLDVKEASEEEVVAYYEENKAKFFEKPEMVQARHILIAFEPEEDDEAKAEKRKKAQQIRDQLKEGADFAKLAEEHSACPSKAAGGDLGEFQRGQMVPAFEEVAFEMEIDEISDVVETQYGYHIIQTVGNTQPRTIEIDEARGRIMEALKGQMVQERAEMMLDNLRRDTTVTYNVEEFEPQAAEVPKLPMLPAAE